MGENIIDLPDVELLEEEETRSLINRAQQGEEKAIDKLVRHNLRLVLKITYRFKNYDYELKDLFQIGVIGLIKAIEAFDLDRDVKFSTYAVTRIIGQIRLYIRDDGIINVSRSLKKIAGTVKDREDDLTKEKGRNPTINELAEDTGYSREKIVRALEANKYPTSLYRPIYEEEGNTLYLLDNLENEDEEQKLDPDKITLLNLLKELDERSRRIIYLRYFEDKTQEEIGEIIGVSQVQISRLEKKIIKKLKKKFNTR